MNKKLLGLTLAAAGAMTLSAGAQALVLEDTFENIFETTEINQTGELSLFDASLGDLTEVTLTLSGNSISTSMLENTASGSQTFSFDSVLNFFLDASSVGVTTPAPAFTTVLASTDGFVTLAAGEFLDLGTAEDNGSWTVTLTGAELAPFIGTGNFSVGCSTISGTTFSGGGGNINNTQETTAACSGSIAYMYDAAVVITPPTTVPAPASLWLMGAGLLGFAAFKKRKSS